MCFFAPQLVFFSFRTKFSETAQAEEKTENKKSGIGSGEDPIPDFLCAVPAKRG